MGVTEVLVPTYDVASGLAIAWTPPARAQQACAASTVPRRTTRGPICGLALVYRSGSSG